MQGPKLDVAACSRAMVAAAATTDSSSRSSAALLLLLICHFPNMSAVALQQQSLSTLHPALSAIIFFYQLVADDRGSLSSTIVAQLVSKLVHSCSSNSLYWYCHSLIHRILNCPWTFCWLIVVHWHWHWLSFAVLSIFLAHPLQLSLLPHPLLLVCPLPSPPPTTAPSWFGDLICIKARQNQVAAKRGICFWAFCV